MNGRILTVDDLSVSFPYAHGRLHAVRQLSLHIESGETLAVVGESGCGKSALARAIMGLTYLDGRIDGGSIKLMGNRIDAASTLHELAAYRRPAAMILQDPLSSLDPLQRIGRQIATAVSIHSELSRREAADEAVRLLAAVGIDRPRERARQYPHEFSGGMRQRAVIAAALACRPRLLVCDEPTTALDVTVQATVIELLLSLKRKMGLSMLFITHDLGVVAGIADRVAVMYAGEIVECGTVREIFYDPRHPYTWSLMSALPRQSSRSPLLALAGNPPIITGSLQGDPFAPRNPYALNIDYLASPPVFSVSPTHFAKTWLLDPRAPHVVRPAGGPIYE